MACFLVPATEAVVSTAVSKQVEKKSDFEEYAAKHPFLSRLDWLNKLLWGGSALLAFEHVWHGEVVPWFPFLTAASDPADTAEMLHEMATVGTTMAALITVVWVAMVLAAESILRRADKAEETA